MKLKRLGSMMAIVAVAGVVGCTDMTPQQQGTLSGAAIGAAGGAGIAAISGGNAWTGAAIGGVAGAVRGSNQDRANQQRYRDSQGLEYEDGKIHRNYNRWVNSLRAEILHQLKLPKTL